MKLIIDMPDEDYEGFKKAAEEDYTVRMIDIDIILNGIPFDLDKIVNVSEAESEVSDETDISLKFLHNIL